MFSAQQWEHLKHLIENGHVSKNEEDPICNFIIDTIKRGHISSKDYYGAVGNGDHLTIPLTVLTDLISSLLVSGVGKEKSSFKTNMKSCPYCGNLHYHIEKSPDGCCVCNHCGTKWKNNDFTNKSQSGITHHFVCSSCSCGNYISHIEGTDYEHCQCCRTPHDSSKMIPMTFEKHSTPCPTCDGSDHRVSTVYGVDYYICDCCGMITLK